MLVGRDPIPPLLARGIPSYIGGVYRLIDSPPDGAAVYGKGGDGARHQPFRPHGTPPTPRALRVPHTGGCDKVADQSAGSPKNSESGRRHTGIRTEATTP